MNYEITPPMEFADSLTVSVDDDLDGVIYVGWKRFDKPGYFHYDWIIEHMDPSDARLLAVALIEAAEIAERAELCADCAAVRAEEAEAGA